MVVTVLHKSNVLLLFWLLCAVHIVASNIYSHEKVSYKVNKNYFPLVWFWAQMVTKKIELLRKLFKMYEVDTDS